MKIHFSDSCAPCVPLPGLSHPSLQRGSEVVQAARRAAVDACAALHRLPEPAAGEAERYRRSLFSVRKGKGRI